MVIKINIVNGNSFHYVWQLPRPQEIGEELF